MTTDRQDTKIVRENQHLQFLKCVGVYNLTRENTGLLRQSLKFREIASSHSEKCCFSSPRISLYVWDHNSKTKALIKKVKICGPPWPTLSNGTPYLCVQSIQRSKTSALFFGCFSRCAGKKQTGEVAY